MNTSKNVPEGGDSVPYEGKACVDVPAFEVFAELGRLPGLEGGPDLSYPEDEEVTVTEDEETDDDFDDVPPMWVEVVDDDDEEGLEQAIDAELPFYCPHIVEKPFSPKRKLAGKKGQVPELEGRKCVVDEDDGGKDATAERLTDVFEEMVLEDPVFATDLERSHEAQLRKLTLDAGQALTPAVVKIMKGPKKVLTSAVYEKYQKMLDIYIGENGGKYNDENTIMNFMEYMSNIYGQGSLWSIFSALNSRLKRKEGKDQKHMVRLMIVMKDMTGDYVAMKACVFGADEIKEVLVNLDVEVPKELLAKVGIALLFFGMLRQGEVMKLKKGDVSVGKTGVHVDFPYATKTRTTGFSYLIPKYLMEAFKVYLGQVSAVPVNERFLKNWSVKGKKRIQNCGVNMVKKWSPESAIKVNKNPKGFTTHSFRRSAATTLADAGVSITNLKRHGRWRSDAVAEGYIDNSKPLLIEKVSMLSGEVFSPSTAITPNAKSARLETPASSPSATAFSPISAAHTNQFNNCTVTIMHSPK